MLLETESTTAPSAGTQINISSYTSANNGVADATAGVAAAVAAAKADGSYLVHTGAATDLWLVTSLSNPYGVEFDGAGKILLAYSDAYGSNKRQLNSTNDRHRDVVGREYLHHIQSLFMAGTASKIVFSGDSITLGVGVTAPYIMSTAIPAMATKYGIPGVTGVNAGHSGKTSSDWINLYLASDLVANPDLYVLRWGVNDANQGITLDQTVTNLRAGLATCRASKSVTAMSIIIMMPNATEYSQSINERHFELLTLGARQAARDYGACFFNTYGLFRDAQMGRNIWLDTYATHPGDSMAMQINSMLSDVIFPTQIRVNG